MLNCSHPDCVLHHVHHLHHHHYYHGHLQHHLQDDRVHHEHPTHHPMSGESDGVQDSVIQGYLNDTNSELSSLSHLDAPNESVYVICGVLIAMLLVGLIIVLLAVTIRSGSMGMSMRMGCCNCRKIRICQPCTQRKLRKREESSGVRSSGGHPEGLQGVLQAPVSEPKSSLVHAPPSLESIFVSPAVPSSDGGLSVPLPVSPSDTSLSSCTSTESTLDSTYSVPMFLYSTANSRNSLNSSDQSIAVHPNGCVPPEEEKRKRSGHGHQVFRGLRRKKTPPSPTYSIPVEYQHQLKKIYVY